MVRETSGRPGTRGAPADLSPIPLPELGVSLDPARVYRFRIGPVNPEAPRRRLWTIHATVVRREGRVVYLQPLRRWGHRSDAPAPVQAIVATRIKRAELLPQEGARSTRSRDTRTSIIGSWDQTERVAPASAPAHEPRYITSSDGSATRPESEPAGALAVAPAGPRSQGDRIVAAALAARQAVWVSAILRTGRPIEAADPIATAQPTPELAAFLLVAHRSHCTTAPEGCDISRGYWASLVELYGTAGALGAFYEAERVLEQRRARLGARSMLALAGFTQAVAS